ncbi:hypothetical protein SUGI_0230460 [Cryptomeria japonica]|uniref:uncharacterized protein LOC131076018 n=1 Tax=Cryptomeria japonica TaxID=3369 RepID=UPI002408D4B3|nr:uncharacterized protein LOC131076018 [Cryptomeria japonica]GLJ14307.1 hypothetical protein SUGI_0230460 [Cryptomeria japonica]
MVFNSKKLVGVRNCAFPAKKWQQRRKQEGVMKNVVGGFKSVVKTLQGAKQIVVRLLADLLELEPESFYSRKALAYKPLEQDLVDGREEPLILPPMAGYEIKMQKKTIVLDLDETLIHSSEEPLEYYDFAVNVVIDGEPATFYVLKRPGMDELLQQLKDRYELVLFTAGIREYADAVVDRIDPYGAIKHRLFRDSCTQTCEGRFVKDLSLLGRDLRRVIIVDDNPNAYVFHPHNAVPVSSFVDDLYDRELSSVISFFKVVQDYEDLREAIRHFVVRDPLLKP